MSKQPVTYPASAVVLSNGCNHYNLIPHNSLYDLSIIMSTIGMPVNNETLSNLV